MVKIDSTKFGEIVINRKTYYSDMIVWWDGKVEYRDKTHIFGMSEYLKLMKRKPEAIVIGIGQQGAIKIREEVVRAAEDEKIKLFIDQSPRAVDIFNGLILQKKRVVAVIHTTC